MYLLAAGSPGTLSWMIRTRWWNPTLKLRQPGGALATCIRCVGVAWHRWGDRKEREKRDEREDGWVERKWRSNADVRSSSSI